MVVVSLPRCGILCCKLRCGGWWSIAKDKSQFGDWASENGGCCLNVDCSDQPIFPREDLDNLSHGPVIGECRVFSDHDDVSWLEVRFPSGGAASTQQTISSRNDG